MTKKEQVDSVQVFVQARMTSRRYPGKVLAPFRGRPLLVHVLEAVQVALPSVRTIVATSSESSDDPVAAFAKSLGCEVFRGPLEDVLERFRSCLRVYSSRWVVRVCADSPLQDPGVLRAVVRKAIQGEWDLVTTIFPRTFPNGRNIEVIRADRFLEIDDGELSMDDREHVTSFYYRHPDRFRIYNLLSGHPDWSSVSLAVDHIEDLQRLEGMTEGDLQVYQFHD